MKALTCMLGRHAWTVLPDFEAASLGGTRERCSRCGKVPITYPTRDREANAKHLINEHHWPV